MALIMPYLLFLYGLIGAFIHELGHITAICCCGDGVKKMHFLIGGIKIIRQRKRLLSYKQDLIIMFAGAFANIIAAVLLLCAGNRQAGCINLCLAFFNLLPLPHLDGGDIVCTIKEMLQ
jgi:membrane-associated protease RseP (regulator of RpoE activity)